MIGGILTVQQLFQRRYEIFGHGAADAAVGQFHHVILGAAFDAAALEDAAIDAKIAEFVDNKRDALAIRVFQHVANEGGFPGAQKTGDDGGRDLGRHFAGSPIISGAVRGQSITSVVVASIGWPLMASWLWSLAFNVTRTSCGPIGSA